MTGLHPELPHILLLFSDTGGGHRSAAQAIIEALNKEYPDQLTVEMVDIFRFYTPLPLNKAPEIYPYLTRFPDMWAFNYHISDGKRRVRTASNLLVPYLYRDLRRLLREHPADLIVPLHWFAIAPVLNVMWRDPTPLVPVVLDLVSTHAAWFDNRTALTIVPTQEAFQKGMEMGMDFDKMTIVGLPIAERFCAPEGDKTALRERLGWSIDRPVILLVGGGDGMGPLEEVAHAINRAKLPVALVIVAGRNRALKERLERYAWDLPVDVYGFVRDMPDFLRAADILVTKAGPNSICEALLAGLPQVLYHRISGQEEGNVSYVVDEGAGVWAPEPEQVVNAIRTWLDQPDGLEKVRANARRLARPTAARDIARILGKRIGLKK